MNTPRELFVWYRCAPAEQAAVHECARALLARVADQCGVQGRLLLRHGEDCTWMEHYRLLRGQAQLDGLRACVQASWPVGAPERHEELFVEASA